MRIHLFPVLFAAALLVSGCASERSDYVKAHPDLPIDHKRIILAGTIKYADPVVGMTKEEIRLAMGSAPDKVETIDGEEVWTWVKEKASIHGELSDPTSIDSVDAGIQAEQRRNRTTSATAAPEKKQIKTTVYFHGDRANRAQIDED
jgi:hypothetical protein